MPGECSSGIASRTRGALAPKREPEDHPNFLWKGASRADKRMLNFNLNKLYFRSIDVPRVLSWTTLATLGCDKVMEDILLEREIYGNEMVTSHYVEKKKFKSRNQYTWSGA